MTGLRKCLGAAERVKWDREKARRPGRLLEGHAMHLVRRGKHEMLVKLQVKPSTRRWATHVAGFGSNVNCVCDLGQ